MRSLNSRDALRDSLCGDAAAASGSAADAAASESAVSVTTFRTTQSVQATWLNSIMSSPPPTPLRLPTTTNEYMVVSYQPSARRRFVVVASVVVRGSAVIMSLFLNCYFCWCVGFCGSLALSM